MSTAQQDSSEKAPKGLSGVESENFGKLKKLLKGNVSWQVLTLRYVEKLERESVGGSSGKKKKGAAAAPDDLDECHLIIKEDEAFGRSGRKYNNWKKGLLQELLHFAEPRCFPLHKKVVDSAMLLRQICDFGFGLNFTEPKSSDFSNNNYKLQTFQSLKTLYVQRGRAFLALNFKDGMIDWCEAGVFGVKTIVAGDSITVIIVDKARGDEKQMPNELLPKNCHFTNKDIMSNYSFKSAHIQIPNEGPFFLHELFPRVRRTLERKISEEVGAVKPRRVGGLLGLALSRDAAASAADGAKSKRKRGREETEKGSGSDRTSGTKGARCSGEGGKRSDTAGKGKTAEEPPSPSGDGELDAGVVAASKAAADAAGAGEKQKKRAKVAGKAGGKGAGKKAKRSEDLTEQEGEDEDEEGGDDDDSKANDAGSEDSDGRKE